MCTLLSWSGYLSTSALDRTLSAVPGAVVGAANVKVTVKRKKSRR